MNSKKRLKKRAIALESLCDYLVREVNDMDFALDIEGNKSDINKLIEELKDVKNEVTSLRMNIADEQHWIFNANKQFEDLKRQLKDLREGYNNNVPQLLNDVKSLDHENVYKFYKLKGDVKRYSTYLSDVYKIESARLVPDKSPKFFTRGLHVSVTPKGVKQYFVVAENLGDAMKIAESQFRGWVYWA